MKTALTDRLRSHLREIARERDPYLAPAGHFYVQEYIRQELGQWGTVSTHSFKIKARTHTNLILNLPGRERSLKPILIGAHYDAVPGTQGADDNASGVAVLLELARSFSESPARHPVQLIAFDLEEYGLSGSKAYAHELFAQQEPVRLMLSLEMVGYCSQEPNSQKFPKGLAYFYPNQGNFIGLIGNIPTMWDMLRLRRAFRQAGVPSEFLPAGWKGALISATRFSDHAPFWDCGYPAIMVTDTAFFRNPHYHQPSDRLETLDLEFMTCITQGVVTGISQL